MEGIKRPELHALTGARFLAALGVLLVHYQYAVAKSLPGWTAKTGLAGIAVSFFFVLSGFVLTYNYMDAFSAGMNRQAVRSYAISRIARIYPIYIVALGAGLIVAAWFRRSPVVGPAIDSDHAIELAAALALNIATLQPFVPLGWVQDIYNAPSWSVGCEVFFYSLLPLFAHFVLSGNRSRSAVIWISVLLLAVQMTLHELIVAYVVTGAEGAARYDARLWIDRFPPFRLFEFLLGSCSGYLFLKRNPTERIGWLKLALVLFLGTEIVRFTLGGPDFPHLIMLGPVFAMAIYGLAGDRGAVTRLLEGRGFKLLGEASYSLYLIHWTPLVAIAAIYGWGRAPMGVTIVTMVGCILASLIIYLGVERPLRSWIRGLDRRPTRARMNAGAFAGSRAGRVALPPEK